MHEPDSALSARIVYDHSANLYAAAIGTRISAQFETPLDQAMLDVFAQQIVTEGLGMVLDVGCGPGRAAAFLSERGVEVVGVDPSTEMLNIARHAHPHLRFEEGSLTQLPFDDSSAVAAVLWYSIIHSPLDQLPRAWSELQRALTANGQVLIGFQSGNNERIERVNAYDSSETLTSFRHSVDDIVTSLIESGFEVRARSSREPQLAHETTPQAFLFVRVSQ